MKSSSEPDRWARRIWICVAITAVALAAFEIGGMDEKTPWHTISFSGQRNWLVNAIVAALFLLGGIGGFIWWEFWHLRQPIYKERE